MISIGNIKQDVANFSDHRSATLITIRLKQFYMHKILVVEKKLMLEDILAIYLELRGLSD